MERPPAPQPPCPSATVLSLQPPSPICHPDRRGGICGAPFGRPGFTVRRHSLFCHPACPGERGSDLHRATTPTRVRNTRRRQFEQHALSIEPILRKCAAFSDSHRSDALYQGTTLVGPYEEPMRALAAEARSSKPNGELCSGLSSAKFTHQEPTDVVGPNAPQSNQQLHRQKVNRSANLDSCEAQPSLPNSVWN